MPLFRNLLRKKQMPAIRNIQVLAVLFLSIASNLAFFSTASAADIAQVGAREAGAYRITGELRRGDFDRFLKTAISGNRRPESIWITSPGGSVEEALKFGRFANQLLVVCLVSGECNSSCFMVVAGCVDRTISVEIGIHRPYFNQEDFAELPFDHAKRNYAALLRAIDDYLTEMNVPRNLIDSMVSVPSESIKYVATSEFNESMGERAPAYHEWIKAKCGTMPDQEKADLSAVKSANLVNVLEDWVRKHGMDDETREMLEYSRMQLVRAQQMSEGYRSYLLTQEKKLRECEDAAKEKEAGKRWRQILTEHKRPAQ